MNNLAKAALFGVGAFVGVRLMIGVSASGGTASQCVTDSVTGYFRAYANTCERPVNAEICSQYLIGAERCRIETVQSGADFIVTATDNAPLAVQLISPVRVRISACKQGYRPQASPEGTNKYTCERLS